jgi:DNA-binding transcriptional LysR family regulator
VFTDIKKLQTFVTIVEEGSFTRAAERLGVAQPWISVQLRQLEHMVDGVLLERSKGKLLKLSETGRELLPIAKRLLEHCEVAGDEIEALRNRRQRLLLGVDPITFYMPERDQLIRDFIARNPEVELHIVNQSPRELFEGLQSGRFDLILAPDPHPDEDVEVLPLYEHEILLAVPAGVREQYRMVDEHGPHGAKVLCLPASYNPTMAIWLKTTVGLSDVRWIISPEVSFPGLVRYAALLGVATLSPDFSSLIPEMRDMELKSLRGHVSLDIRWSLMRRPGYQHKAAERLWRLATNSSPAQAPSALVAAE